MAAKALTSITTFQPTGRKRNPIKTPSMCSFLKPFSIRHLRFLPHPSPPLSLRFLTAFGSSGAPAGGGAGGGGGGRGVGAGWVGREPGGCGLAATLQLVAGDGVPPARPSDGGEEICLDTHTRTQLGTSPGGSCRLGRAGGRAAAVTAPAAGSGALAPLGTGGSETQEGKIPAALTVALLGKSGGSRLPDLLSQRTPEALPSALGVRGRAGARVGRGGCAPPPAEPLRARALRGLGLRRLLVPCLRRGSAPCRTWFQLPGEVQATHPKLHYFSPASSPFRLHAWDLAAAAAACVWGPPASYSHARTHSAVARSLSRRLAHRGAGARASETTGPTDAGTEGADPRPGATRSPRPPPRPGRRDNQVPRGSGIGVLPSPWRFWCLLLGSRWPALKYVEIRESTAYSLGNFHRICSELSE
ncbi:SKI family transcriptional corepressor 1-like [Lutra lutra]|uniref:SKI family transcriptional corepressor 1-like n=1 Tax=Lutra lutra TaxID=9657 RepID=UPI001FCFF805|nr:SKI family transcriptional corepressor 1-like [Lutra lutra]